MVASYEDLDVYKRAYRLALGLHKESLMFPKIEQYAMADQIRRSSKSVCGNLAEGFAKGHKSAAEFKRFALMAVGSAEETRVWINFARDLGYIADDISVSMRDDYTVVCKQINTLIAKWKN